MKISALEAPYLAFVEPNGDDDKGENDNVLPFESRY